MSRLEYYNRPLTAFDPSNKQHRKWFADYVARRAWGHCPVRFIVPDEHGDLIALINNSLLKFYMGKEFGHLEC
jgi:hypothetical protein